MNEITKALRQGYADEYIKLAGKEYGRDFAGEASDRRHNLNKKIKDGKETAAVGGTASGLAGLMHSGAIGGSIALGKHSYSRGKDAVKSYKAYKKSKAEGDNKSKKKHRSAAIISALKAVPSGVASLVSGAVGGKGLYDSAKGALHFAKQHRTYSKMQDHIKKEKKETKRDTHAYDTTATHKTPKSHRIEKRAGGWGDSRRAAKAALKDRTPEEIKHHKEMKNRATMGGAITGGAIGAAIPVHAGVRKGLGAVMSMAGGGDHTNSQLDAKLTKKDRLISGILMGATAAGASRKATKKGLNEKHLKSKGIEKRWHGLSYKMTPEAKAKYLKKKK